MVPLCAVLALSDWLLALRSYTSEDAYHMAATLAILVGGGWTFYRFALRRSFESALSIDYSVTTEPAAKEGDFVVFFDAEFANVGNRRLSAPRKLKDAQKKKYCIKFAGNLQIRRVLLGESSPSLLNWWQNTSDLKADPILNDIDLLLDYVDDSSKTKAPFLDFFMEPGEKCQLGTVFVLPRGHYVARLVFVGDRERASEYWSRLVYFTVPTEPKSKPQVSGPGSPAPAPQDSAEAGNGGDTE